MNLTPLPHTDDAHFDADVASAPAVLIVFSGTWCPPCRALEPTLQALAADRPNLRVVEIDVDENQGLAQRFMVRSIPSLFLFKEGRVASQRLGNQTRRQLEEWLSSTGIGR